MYKDKNLIIQSNEQKQKIFDNNHGKSEVPKTIAMVQEIPHTKKNNKFIYISQKELGADPMDKIMPL